MEKVEIETLNFDYLLEMSDEELLQIAEEKELPNTDELSREELITVVELAILSGLTEAEEENVEEEEEQADEEEDADDDDLAEELDDVVEEDSSDEGDWEEEE